MKIGSCFSGVGAMDLAAEHYLGAHTAWLCEREPHCRRVLARHWPDVPIYDDVTTLLADGAERVDVIIGGPPCQDLSVAGKQAGLDGERSGMFYPFIEVCAELRPDLVLLENVPPLLRQHRGDVERAFRRAGYGVTWVLLAAQHVGAPHKRMRAFLRAELGGRHRGVVETPPMPDVGAWSSPMATHNRKSARAMLASKDNGRRSGGGQSSTPGLEQQVEMGRGRPPRELRGVPASELPRQLRSAAETPPMPDVGGWPTPTAGDSKGSGSRSLPTSKAHAGVSLTDATERFTTAWATPTVQDGENNGGPSQYHRNSKPLNVQAGGRLNPAWVAQLQGLPAGWTDAEGPSLRAEALALLDAPQWPAPMVRELWGDSPQHPHEVPRVVAKGTCPDRPKRLRALGNANCPQQYLAAFALLDAGPAQRTLL